MTKQYKFLILLGIFLIVLQLVIRFTYQQYQVKKTMDMILESNMNAKSIIGERRELISYKNSKAYKNKILKEQDGLKSKGETVLYITTEEDYNKYTAPYKLEISDFEDEIQSPELEGLTNIEKWKRFIFGT